MSPRWAGRIASPIASSSLSCRPSKLPDDSTHTTSPGAALSASCLTMLSTSGVSLALGEPLGIEAIARRDLRRIEQLADDDLVRVRERLGELGLERLPAARRRARLVDRRTH